MDNYQESVSSLLQVSNASIIKKTTYVHLQATNISNIAAAEYSSRFCLVLCIGRLTMSSGEQDTSRSSAGTLVSEFSAQRNYKVARRQWTDCSTNIIIRLVFLCEQASWLTLVVIKLRLPHYANCVLSPRLESPPTVAGTVVTLNSNDYTCRHY